MHQNSMECRPQMSPKINDGGVWEGLEGSCAILGRPGEPKTDLREIVIILVPKIVYKAISRCMQFAHQSSDRFWVDVLGIWG